jgi:hypothetical protein
MIPQLASHVLARRFLTALIALIVAGCGGLWSLRLIERGGSYRIVGWAITIGGMLFFGGSMCLLWLTDFPWSWNWWW